MTTMTAERARYLTVVETAKLVRAALKAAFPGVKFSVRSDSYAGGASIRVRWTDGPREQDVAPVARAYEGSRFDGMIDLKYGAEHFLNPDGTVTLARTYGHGMGGDATYVDQPPPGAVRVHLGADFVFVDRDLSPAYQAVLKVKGQECLDQSADHQGATMDDPGFTPGSIPTRYDGACLPAYSPAALVWALSRYIAPDGTTYTNDN